MIRRWLSSSWEMKLALLWKFTLQFVPECFEALLLSTGVFALVISTATIATAVSSMESIQLTIQRHPMLLAFLSSDQITLGNIIEIVTTILLIGATWQKINAMQQWQRDNRQLPEKVALIERQLQEHLKESQRRVKELDDLKIDVAGHHSSGVMLEKEVSILRDRSHTHEGHIQRLLAYFENGKAK